MTRRITALRRAALVAAVVPVFAACQDALVNDTMGARTPDNPALADPMFYRYAAIGTSLGSGEQSAGVNDSTQREAYTYQLAKAMGLTPGVDWLYPSFTYPGCPAPLTQIYPTQAWVGGVNPLTNPAQRCYLRNPVTAGDNMQNASVPGIRAAQVMDLGFVSMPGDTNSRAVFYTGGLAPIVMVERQQPTFVTIEVGGNDVLRAATGGDTLLLAPLTQFNNAIDSIAARLNALDPAPMVAIANVPNAAYIPNLSKGYMYFCLKTGACPGVAATLPFSLATFTVDASCAPTAPTGAKTLTPFATATGQIAGVLAAGGAASINCATGVATVTTTAGTSTLPTVNPTEYDAITARVTAFNAHIRSVATANGWAYVNLDSAFAALAANPASVPPFPVFTTPSYIFGPLFSLDGVHPRKAGHRIMAQLFAAAINTTYTPATPLVIP